MGVKIDDMWNILTSKVYDFEEIMFIMYGRDQTFHRGSLFYDEVLRADGDSNFQTTYGAYSSTYSSYWIDITALKSGKYMVYDGAVSPEFREEIVEAGDKLNNGKHWYGGNPTTLIFIKVKQ